MFQVGDLSDIVLDHQALRRLRMGHDDIMVLKDEIEDRGELAVWLASWQALGYRELEHTASFRAPGPGVP